MKENHSHVTRGKLWAMCLAAVLCSGSGRATWAQQPAEQPPVGPQQNKAKLWEGEKGLVRAFDLKGNKLWDFETSGMVEEVVPNGDFVFVLATDGQFFDAGTHGIAAQFLHNKSKIYALDRKTGQQRWVFDNQADVFTRPILADDKVLVASMGLGEHAAVHALNMVTGTVIWKLPLPSAVQASLPKEKSMFEVVGHEVYVACAKDIFVVDIDSGKRLSKISWADIFPPEERVESGVIRWIPGKYLILEGRFFRDLSQIVKKTENVTETVGGYEAWNVLICVDALTGKVQWTKDKNKIYGGSLVTIPDGKEDKLLVSVDRYYVGCLDRATGKPIWEIKSEKPIGFGGTPVQLKDKTVLIVSENNGQSGNNYTSTRRLVDPTTGLTLETVEYSIRVGLQFIKRENGRDYFVFEDPKGMEDTLECHDTITGNILWTYGIHPHSFRPFLFYGDRLFHVNFGRLACIDVTTGQKLWAADSGGYLRSLGEDTIFITSFEYGKRLR